MQQLSSLKIWLLFAIFEKFISINEDHDQSRSNIRSAAKASVLGIKSIYNLVSHCLPCNSSHNVMNHAIGFMEAFSNVNIVAKLLAKLQEVESSCKCAYNCVGGVIT